VQASAVKTSSGGSPPLPGTSARIVSLNVGMPQTVVWRGREVTTGIYKAPVADRLNLGRSNLDGDGQADPVHHGGADKAVYAYPCEHYRWWREQLGDIPGGWGAFGENLTVSGMPETEIRVGDLLEAGTAVLRVTEPRSPCFKLAMRLGCPDVVRRFARANRTGFYCAVEREGELGAGDRIRLLQRSPGSPTIAELTPLRLFSGRDDRDAVRAALEAEALTDAWRGHLRKRLAKLDWLAENVPQW
jgi:MOSC domain-containing protein YiiM